MLNTVSHLTQSTVSASDGPIGKLKAAFFDDQAWAIRYLVVDTGEWFAGRRVLLSPYSVQQPLGHVDDVAVKLTREQVRNSPDIDTHQPVSRQHERALLGYYAYPTYWEGGGLWGTGSEPVAPSGMQREVQAEVDKALHARDVRAGDLHLRDSTRVIGYDIRATDDSIGHVQDFIFDDLTWAIRYLVVDTRNWWPGGEKVLIGTQWIDRIDWATKAVYVTMTRDQVKRSPLYFPDAPLMREDEQHLHDVYGRTGYWVAAAAATAATTAATTAAALPAVDPEADTLPSRTTGALFLPRVKPAPIAAPGVESEASRSAVPPVYVYNTHQEADAAIQALSRSGFDVKKLSLVGKGYHTEEHPLGFYTLGDKVRTWGGMGAFWGGVWGLLVAPAVFFIPGVGLVAMAGPVVAALVAALEGAALVGGLSAIGAALTRIGVPSDQVLKYETALKVDKYVLMVHGDAADAAQAGKVLSAAAAAAGTWQAA